MLAEEALKLAWQHQAAGNHSDAEQLCRRVLHVAPQMADAWSLLGLLAQAAQHTGLAIELLERAAALRPDVATYRLNLGVALAAAGRDEEAIDYFRQVTRLAPDLAQGHYNLGKALHHRSKSAEAAECYQRAARLSPGFGEVWCNLAAALHELGDFDAALHAIERAFAERPAHSPPALYCSETHNNFANVLRGLGRYAEARENYQRALELLPDAPDACWNRGTLCLLEGRFQEGWPDHRWRWKLPDRGRTRDFIEPLWDGRELSPGALLIHCEQGLGDALQFIRYVRLGAPRVARLVVECQAALAGLLSRMPEIDQLVVRGEPLPVCDAQAPLLSLPEIFGTTLETIPGDVPYLTAGPERLARWRAALPSTPEFRVGITWQGNPAHRLDRHRSFSIEHLAPLAAVSGVRIYSLQKGPGSEQLADFGPKFGVVDLESELADFEDTAAAVARLDLAVCCDSAPAHLAGAVGVPVWIPLAFSPDWRWLLERADSPWYPTMRLFRQQRPGDWETVFGSMADELATLAAHKARRLKQHAELGRPSMHFRNASARIT